MKFYVRRILSCALVLGFIGCGAMSGNIAPDSAIGLIEDAEVDVFFARGFLGGSDYERYHLQGDLLWRECGSLEPNSDGSGNSQPNLIAAERRAETLKSGERRRLQEAALALIHAGGSGSAQLAKPGAVFGLNHSGLAEIKLKYGKLNAHELTSVDEIGNRKSEIARAAYNFSATLRGLGPVICRAKSFFGIKRLEN